MHEIVGTGMASISEIKQRSVVRSIVIGVANNFVGNFVGLQVVVADRAYPIWLTPDQARGLAAHCERGIWSRWDDRSGVFGRAYVELWHQPLPDENAYIAVSHHAPDADGTNSGWPGVLLSYEDHAEFINTLRTAADQAQV